MMHRGRCLVFPHLPRCLNGKGCVVRNPYQRDASKWQVRRETQMAKLQERTGDSVGGKKLWQRFVAWVTANCCVVTNADGNGRGLGDCERTMNWLGRAADFLASFVTMVVIYFAALICLRVGATHILGIDKAYALKLTPFLTSIVWPVTVIVVFILLRDVICRMLYQMPGFIRRSRFVVDNLSEAERSKAITHSDKRRNEKYEADNMGKESDGYTATSVSGKVKGLDDSPGIISPDIARNAELEILSLIEEEYLVTGKMIRDAEIYKSRFVFDAAFWKGAMLYAVEIKVNTHSIRSAIERVKVFAQELPWKYQDHFTLILCIITTAVDNVRENVNSIICDVGLNVIVKYYPLSDFQTKNVNS